MIAFPGLYKAADRLSNSAQWNYLLLVRIEYAILIVLAVLFSSLGETFASAGFAGTLLAGSIVIRVLLVAIEPDRVWYAGRAMAESVKTLTWQFAVRGAQFPDAERLADATFAFSNVLQDVVQENRKVFSRLPILDDEGSALPRSVLTARAKPLIERIQLYQTDRVKNQLDWYRKKSKANKRQKLVWTSAVLSIYAGIYLFLFAHNKFPQIELDLIDPVLVLIASLMGWMQVRRYGEIQSSYRLTANEIEIASARLGEHLSEQEFANSVDQIERAFSREHTQWLARQDRPK